MSDVEVDREGTTNVAVVASPKSVSVTTGSSGQVGSVHTSPTTVTVAQSLTNDLDIDPNNTRVVEVAGGLQGPVGPAGRNGGDYTHVQSSVSNTWEIQHGLGYHPSFTVYDSGGTQIEGFDVEPVSADVSILRFSSAFSGLSYAS